MSPGERKSPLRGTELAHTLARRLRRETDIDYFEKRHAEALLEILAEEISAGLRARRTVKVPAIGRFAARVTQEYLIGNKATRRVYVSVHACKTLRERLLQAVAGRNPSHKWQRKGSRPPGSADSGALDTQRRLGDNAEKPAE